jgi:hypothetical protein
MKNLIKALALTLTAIFMTACPDNSSSNKNNGSVCVNCGITAANQVQFATNMTAILPQGALSLSLTADSNQLNYLVSFGQNPIFAYQGQSLASGVLNLNYDLVFGVCRLPRGQYQLTTIGQPGTYGMGVFQFPQVQITGPVSMTAAIVQGVILTDGLGSIRGMSTVLVGLTGFPAIQGWGPYPLNGQTPCGDGIGVRF